MDDKGVAAYIVPTADPHQSEYVGEYFKTREWISGFTGSAGTVIITKERALLWTDGRYFIQAEKELKDSDYELMKMGNPQVPNYTEWLGDYLNKGDTLAFDGQIVAESLAKKLENILEDKEIEFLDEFDLVGEIWTDRPELPRNEIIIHDIKYAGLKSDEKISQVRKIMKEKKADYFLIGSLDDIAWLYNIRGRDIAYSPVAISYGIVTMEKAFIFIDRDKVSSRLKEYFEENNIEIKNYEEVFEFVKDINKNSTMILDEDKINRYLFKNIAKEVNIINEMDITSKFKAIKNESEIKNQRNAYIKDGVALVKFLCWLDRNNGKSEINEITAADKLESFRKEQDLFIEPSFETISAYGPNAAMAHYRATSEDYSPLGAKGLYLIDSGGQYLDGTTDITRTVALGELREEEKMDFTLTLKGHINLISSKFLEGTNGYQLDILSRQALWKEGLDYKHGTGHGIGFFLNVHEGPHRIASVFNDIALEEGMIMSIEPGLYKNGKHGIRIENIVAVKRDIETEFGRFLSFEVLSYAPIDSSCIEKSLLNNDEIQWLNNYHKEVYSKLVDYLTEDEKIWLEDKTREI